MKIKFLVVASVIGVIITIAQASVAADSGFPNGCQDHGYVFKDKSLLLIPEANQQSVYLIQNFQSQTIVMHYFNPGQPNLGNWDTEVKNESWSSFAADTPILFICKTLSGKKDAEPLDCQTTLKVCQYLKAEIPVHMLGSYFVIKDDYSSKAVVRHTIKEGILLR